MRSTASSRSHSFSKHHRLSLQRDFRHAFRKGQRLESEWAVLLAAPNGLGHDRLGIVVSRKLGNAVQRNRVKRRIREWFRRREKDSGFDLVIMPRRSIAELGMNQEVARKLDELIRRVMGQR